VRVLLDTCTFLWMVSGSDRLSKDVSRLIIDPDNEVLLSAASAWEITVKHGLGRLPLPDDPARYIPKLRRAHGVDTLPLDEESTLQLGKLPALHRDPFDRVLVCQAIVNGLVLLTPDDAIRQYPVRTRW